MGTCGLVGPIGVYTAMGGGTSMWVGILLVCFLLPAVLTFVFGEVLRSMGWIKGWGFEVGFVRWQGTRTGDCRREKARWDGRGDFGSWSPREQTDSFSKCFPRHL